MAMLTMATPVSVPPRRRRPAPVWLAIVGAAMLCGGCQPLPRPFAHENELDAALLRIPDGVGIYVDTPTFGDDFAGPRAGGDDDGSGGYDALAPAMAAALLRADIVATSGAVRNASNFILRPEIGNDEIRWHVVDADGAAVGTHAGRLTAAAATALRGGEPKEISLALRPHLDDTAARVVTLIKGDADAAGAANEIAIHVAPVVGAPGSGNRELTQSMRLVLGGVDGLELVAEPDGAMVIAGTVTMGPEENGAQPIDISWALYAPDRSELGTIDQGNLIAAGSLDGRWGETARQIALAAATGLTEMLTRLADGAADAGMNGASSDDR